MKCKCLKARRARVEPVTNEARYSNAFTPVFKRTPCFFMVVGHNAESGGAVNYLGQNEYRFYLEGFPITAKYLEKFCPIIPAYIITRPAGLSYDKQVKAVCKKINAITQGQPSLGFNGHFNSTRGAIGSEGLVARGTKESFDDLFADIFTDLLAEIGIKQRHKNGIKYVDSGHNGFGMINGMAKTGCTTIIGEPCFNYRYFESMQIFDTPYNIDRYFKLIAIAIIRSYLQRGIIKTEDIKDATILGELWQN